MDFEQLKNQFAVLSGISDCENGDLYVWFNEAQADLAMSGGMVAKEIYDVEEGGQELSLPDRFLQVVDCNGSYALTPDGKIIFDSPGQVEVYNYR